MRLNGIFDKHRHVMNLELIEVIEQTGSCEDEKVFSL